MGEDTREINERRDYRQFFRGLKGADRGNSRYYHHMNLLRTLATVSGMTLLSRILGFVRDFVIAHGFGAGMATDAFFVAFRLPNLLRRLFAEGAFSQAFVPILAEYRNQRGDEATKTLVDHVAGVLFICLVGITALGGLGAPLLIAFTAPGFSADPEKFALTVELTQIVRAAWRERV